MSGKKTSEEECKKLYDLAENARRDWQTKHAASCKVEGEHSPDCQNAYNDYQTKLSKWAADCSKP
ncbi:hypothetical protein AB7942_29155 [Neobacillus sp. BF23-41]|uniref:hypothetical protein n=1 Tax=Neobacillus sp. BF23-41 TaxID=3240280 RepID=UPI0034E3FEDD